MNKHKLIALLHQEYHEFYILGFHHSLMDGDYWDVNNFPPESYVRMRGEASLHDFRNSIPADWCREDLSLIEFQIVNQAIVFKSENWDEVGVEYLTKYAGGICFVEEYSFHYYFAAWAKHYLAGSVPGNDGIGSFIFAILERHTDPSGSAECKFKVMPNKTILELMKWVMINDLQCAKDADKIMRSMLSSQDRPSGQ